MGVNKNLKIFSNENRWNTSYTDDIIKPERIIIKIYDAKIYILEVMR